MTALPIEELKAKEQKITNDLLDPSVSEITLPRGFFPEQVGLREVMCDGLGRIWDTAARPMRVIYDPRWNARASLESFRAGAESGEKA